MFFILDVSASQEIGAEGSQKIDIGKEICALLAMSAIKEGSQSGLICFSDEKEKYIKPGKGIKQSYQIVSNIFNLVPSSIGTNLSMAFRYTLNLLKRKSIIVVVSDFIDEDYQHDMKAIAKLHDLVVIHISDIRETTFPKLGIIPLEDKETNKTLWMNTSSPGFRKMIDRTYKSNQDELKKFCMKNGANYLHVRTDEDYVSKLIRLFKVRNKSRKSG